jgi:hypothetical protein
MELLEKSHRYSEAQREKKREASRRYYRDRREQFKSAANQLPLGYHIGHHRVRRQRGPASAQVCDQKNAE